MEDQQRQQQMGHGQSALLQKQQTKKCRTSSSSRRTKDPHNQIDGLSRPVYKQGSCAKRLSSYMLRIKERPKHSNIEFWRSLVGNYFTPSGSKRWCTSSYGEALKVEGVCSQDKWVCELCKVRPTYGYETTTEILPRLLKIRYDGQNIYEHLYLEEPAENQIDSDHILLSCDKVTQEIVFNNASVVRKATLRVLFKLDLKICSWEFCIHDKERFVPTRPSASMSCVPGYSRAYLRNIQVADVCVRMKDLMGYSLTRGTSPKESMVKYVEEFKSSHHMNQSQQMTPNSQPQNSVSSVKVHPSIWVKAQGKEPNVQQQAHHYGIAPSKNFAGSQLVNMGYPQRTNLTEYFQAFGNSRNQGLIFDTAPSARVIRQSSSLSASQIYQSNANYMRRQYNDLGGSSPLAAAGYNTQNNQHTPEFKIPRIEDLIPPQTYPGEYSGIHGVGTSLPSNMVIDQANINYSDSKVLDPNTYTNMMIQCCEEISGAPVIPISSIETMTAPALESYSGDMTPAVEESSRVMMPAVKPSSGGMTTTDQNIRPQEEEDDFVTQLLRFVGVEDTLDHSPIP